VLEGRRVCQMARFGEEIRCVLAGQYIIVSIHKILQVTGSVHL